MPVHGGRAGLNAPEPPQRLMANGTLAARYRPIGLARSLDALLKRSCEDGVVDCVAPERI